MNRRTVITLLIALTTLMMHAQLTDWQNISSKNFVTKIIHDQNFLYIGTKGGGIVKMDKQSGEQTVLKRADGSMTGNSRSSTGGTLDSGATSIFPASFSIPTGPCSWGVSQLCTLSTERKALPYMTSTR